MRAILLTAAAALAATAPVRADEVTDTIQSALAAYEEGDVKYALEELAYAQQMLLAMKAEGLAAFLPEAPEGWTRTVNTEVNSALAMMGGGTGAEAEYSRDGERFTVTLTADSPMVAMFSGMFGNAAVLAASGAKTHRLGRERFIDQDGQITGLIDNRVLVQASGASAEVVLPVLETIDFRGLARFGS